MLHTTPRFQRLQDLMISFEVCRVGLKFSFYFYLGMQFLFPSRPAYVPGCAPLNTMEFTGKVIFVCFKMET